MLVKDPEFQGKHLGSNYVTVVEVFGQWKCLTSRKNALYQYIFINKFSFEGWITAHHCVLQHTLVQRACQQLKLTKDDYYV